MKKLRLTVADQARLHVRNIRAMLRHPHDFTMQERLCVLNRWKGFRKESRRLAWDYRHLHKWRPNDR